MGVWVYVYEYESACMFDYHTFKYLICFVLFIREVVVDWRTNLITDRYDLYFVLFFFWIDTSI